MKNVTNIFNKIVAVSLSIALIFSFVSFDSAFAIQAASVSEALANNPISVNDPYASCDPKSEKYAFYLDNEHIREAWNLQKTNGKVTVAVLDSGITMDKRYRLDDMSEDVIDYEHAWDCSDEGSKKLSDDYIDYHNHGTAVASMIAAEVNNGSGVAGVSWNAKVLPIVITNNYSGCNLKNMVNAYDYVMEKAKELNIKVVNISAGSDDPNNKNLPALKEKIERAWKDYGIITIASAGNNGDNGVNYPACFDNVVSVGAVDKYSYHWNFSNHNNMVDLCASGQDIYLPQMWDESNKLLKDESSWYSKCKGTSFSTPIVSGIAALLYTQDNTRTADDVERILEETATDLGTPGRDDYYGYGQVNAYKALSGEEATPSYYDTQYDLSLLDVQLSCYKYNYTPGNIYKPQVTIKNDFGSVRNYEVKYSNNTSIGRASVTVTATGTKYRGSKTVYFDIEPYKIASVELDRASFTYDGTPKKPNISYVFTDDMRIVYSCDYDVKYYRGSSITKDFTSAGVITVKVTGKGECYAGTASASYSINKVNQKITVKNKRFTVKLKKAKKKNHSFNIGAKASSGLPLSYKVVKKDKGISFKNGKITLKKNKKYKKSIKSIKIEISAPGNGSYDATTNLFTIKFTLK